MGLRYDWVRPNYSEQLIKDFQAKNNLPEFASKILVSRGIFSLDEIRSYMIEEFDEGFDPYLMYDMDKAVARINKAIENEEKILIYGDYDADGITSTVLMLETLISLGADVSSYIPNRFNEGYGPNKEAFKKIIDSNISLIITVDNGIAGVSEIDFANSLGCDVIVTDHHKIQDTLPNAYAIIHPEHPKGNYPFKKLAGVGVAFKLAHALLGIYPDFFLDLVSIGTVADLVPMQSENRIFVKQGLALLNEDSRLGLRCLLDLANHTGIIDEETIGFVIAPRLNAIGRISSAKEGLVFLTTENLEEAQLLAQKIDSYNIERKEITENIVLDVVSKLEKCNDDVIVVYNENYHEGVLGIVASNIVEKYNKPALIMNLDEGNLKGSARSYGDFNIYEAMNKINNLFTAFGGHSMAAGFSTNIDNVEKIKEELSLMYKEYLEENENKKPTKNIDIITNQSEISYQLLNEIEYLKPFGVEFEKPSILVENAKIIEKITFGNNKQYLKLIIGNEYDKIECISFKDNDIYNEILEQDTVDILCNLNKNSFSGRTKLQIQILDIQKKEYLFNDYRLQKVDFNNLKKENLKLSRTYSDNENNYYKYNEMDNIYNKKFDIIELLEVPSSIKYIEKIKKLTPKKVNVYCKEKNPTYLEYNVSKEILIKLFNLLLKLEKIELNIVNVNKLVKNLNVNIQTLKILIKIFEELSLVSVENNILAVNRDYTAIKLENSKTYTAIKERFYVERLFLNESIESINEILKTQEW